MRLIAFLLLLASLAACTGTEAACDESYDRFLRSTDTDVGASAAATAVGGRQRYTEFEQHCDVETPSELRIAHVADPALATVEIFNGVAVVTGVADGMTRLDTTGVLYSDSASIAVATIDHIALSGQSVMPAVFATGTPFAVIMLRDRNDAPIVDDSLTVSGALALGDRWDHLAIGNLAPGDYALTIHAGGTDWPVTIQVTP